MNSIKVSRQLHRAMASSEIYVFVEPDQLQVQDLCWIRCRDERKRGKGRLLPPPCRPVERWSGVQGAAIEEIFCGLCFPSPWPPPWTWCPRVCLAPVWSRDKPRAALNDRSTFRYNNQIASICTSICNTNTNTSRDREKHRSENQSERRK